MNTATPGSRRLYVGSLLGALAVLVLLLAYVVVLRKGVHQADASRRANALLDEAHWRCKGLKQPGQRDDCLRRFRDESPGSSAALQLLVSAATQAPAVSLGAPR